MRSSEALIRSDPTIIRRSLATGPCRARMSMARSSRLFCRKSIRASAAMTSWARSMSAPSKAVVALSMASLTSFEISTSCSPTWASSS